MELFQKYFLIFLMYSFLGWALEVLCKIKDDKKFINRGFFIGPYCPIYGTGAILITVLLEKYIDDVLGLFIMSMVVCGILEYLTSYFMEKIFKARWWDYSKRKFNINGRVCLGTIIPFGILGCLIMYIINPLFYDLLNKISPFAISVLFKVLSGLFLIDIIISMNIIYNFATSVNNIHLNLKFDSTEKMAQKVRESILEKKSIWEKRLLESFPRIESIKQKIIRKK